jgi:DNA-binding LytR/AlgR family response regulator
MRQVIIINDHPQEVKLLADYLQQSHEFSVTGIYDDISAALPVLQKNPVDLVISRSYAIAAVTENKKDHPFPVLVCMGNNEEIEQQEENTDIFAYLRTPVSFERVLSLQQNIESYMLQLMTSVPAKRKYVFIKSDYKLIRINLADILFLSGLRDYTQVYLKGKTSPLTTLQNLKEFETKLTESDFIRVHRSYIISLSQVDSISRNEISIGTHTIPIGNAYREMLDNAIIKNS